LVSERARRKRDKEQQKAAFQSPSQPGPTILCEDTQPQTWSSVTPEVTKRQPQFIPESEALESDCEQTESLEVQSNFYGFKYRDIEKDQVVLKALEAGSYDINGSGVICTVGESPTTLFHPTNKTGISQTPKAVPKPSRKCNEKRKLLTRDSLPPFDAQQEAEKAPADTQSSIMTKRKRCRRDDKIKQSDKESTSKVIQQPCSEHGEQHSPTEPTQTDKDLNSGTSKVKDRISLALFQTPKTWRKPQLKRSGANDVTDSRAKRKKVSGSDLVMDSKENRRTAQQPINRKKKEVKVKYIHIQYIHTGTYRQTNRQTDRHKKKKTHT
jgi:hypothetical protein